MQRYGQPVGLLIYCLYWVRFLHRSETYYFTEVFVGDEERVEERNGGLAIMKTTIFYFSGTGNSLYVARKIADGLGDCSIHSMAAFRADSQIGGADERTGFVFPSYYSNLPRIVRRFIDGLDINPETWLFGTVTMGAPMGLGNGAAIALEKVLEERGLTLRYCYGITMPRNYVLKYNPLSPESATKFNTKADKRVKKIVEEIKSGKSVIHKSSMTANNLYENIDSLDESFLAEDHCTGCGQCERICPVQNIKLINGRPEWQHRCEHCVACISWCPENAIQFGDMTKGRRRYHNTDVKVSELMS